MRHLNIALGFYQNLVTAQHVIKKLRKKGFHRIALVQHTKDGKDVVNTVHSPSLEIKITLGIIFTVIFFFSFSYLSVAANIFILAMMGLISSLVWYFSGIDSEIVNL